MKKTTLGVLLVSSLFSVAQNAIQPSFKPVLQTSKIVSNFEPTINVNERNLQALQTGSFHYIINYGVAKAQYVIAVDNVSASDFSYYANPLFMDSTVRYSSSAATDYTHVMRAGVVIDPTSPFLDPNQSGTPLITKADAYSIDTIAIRGYYQTRTGIEDTLLIEVCWGDTLPGDVFEQVSAVATGQRWLTPHLNSSSSNGNVSFLTAPSTNHVRLKYVLSEADTFNKNITYIIPVAPQNGGVPINIPAGQIASISYTFIPGETYTFGDVNFAYLNNIDPPTRNGFAALMLGEKSTTPVGYFYDTNANFNANLEYYNIQRYGLLTVQSGLDFLNSCMSPELASNYFYDIACSITNQFSVGMSESSNAELKVYQNSPNPANNSTIVNYDLKSNAQVTLDIFDMTGKKVDAINVGTQNSGNHSVFVNTESLQAGVYFYTLSSGENKVTKKLTVVK